MAGGWREQAQVPEDVRALLPRGYDVVGSVAIVRLPEQFAEDDGLKARIGEALLAGVPNAVTAAVDWGVEGQLRARSLEVLAGEPSLLTEDKENGLRLLVDLATCYYSPRLAGERQRVADLVAPGERVLDMYAGVGPYAVLIAKQRATRVLALELNPHAARLCRKNAARNKVPELVDVVHTDAPRLACALPPVFDRAILNLPHTAVEHLDQALAACKPGATLHVGAMLAKDDHEQEAGAIAARHGAQLEQIVQIRAYNPAVGHYSLELVKR